MSLRPVADLISQQLSGVFSGIDPENIQSSIWDGTLELNDLTLNKARLNPKLGSVRVLSSHVERVHVSIPWKRIYEESVLVEVEGLNLQLLCDRSVPIDTLWLERIHLIEAIQESLRLREAFGIFSLLLRTMLRKARIIVKNVMVNVSIGDVDMATFRCGSITIEADSSIQDISSEALNKIARVENFSVALNGNPILEVDGSPKDGLCFTCNARMFQGSLSLNLDFPENVKVSVRERNFLGILALIFEKQKTLSVFRPPISEHALESLRIEYMYMLENPSPNWSERKRFIEMSVSPLLVATWRRQISRNVGINVRDLFSSISNIGSPERTPPVTSDTSQVLSGPLKIDVRLVNCVLVLDLPESDPFSMEVSKSIISLVFPVGNNSDEFTGRLIFSNVRARIRETQLISFDLNATVLRSIANGTEYDFSLKHGPDGFILTPSTIKSLSGILAALPSETTQTITGESIMENVDFLTRDLKESKVQLTVGQLVLHVTTSEGRVPVVFQVGKWNCSYSFSGGLQAKSDPVTISRANECLALLPGIQIVTDDDGATSLFVAGPIEVKTFPTELLPREVEIKQDILDSERLRLSHLLFYQIMKRFNLNTLIFNAPLVRVEGFSLERVQVDVVLSDEGFDVSGSTSTCEVENDLVKNFQLDPILSKPNKVIFMRASHMGTDNQTPICIETGSLTLSLELPTNHRPAIGVDSIVNLIQALKPMVNLEVPKAKISISTDFQICHLRVDHLRFSDSCLQILKLDCELPDMDSLMLMANESSTTNPFDPSDVLPNFQVNEVYVMGRFDTLNEDVIVGCTNLVHSGQTNYSATRVFASTEAGCILEMRSIKANRDRAETIDGVVVNLSRQLIKLLEGIVESAPKPHPTTNQSSMLYNLNLSSVHFNFRDEHIISHADLSVHLLLAFDFDPSKHVITIADSSRVEVRKIELTELNTKTLVLRNDTRNSEPLRINCAGKVVIPLDDHECVQVNMHRIDLLHGFRFVLEDIKEIKRLFELLSVSDIESHPKRSVDLNCAIGIIDPLHVTAYSSGRPIMSTSVQAGLVSVYHSVVPNIRSTTKILIPETKIESSIRNLKRGSWDSLLRDSGFSLEVSEIRDFGNDEAGSLRVNLSGLGDVRIGVTPDTIGCIRALTEQSRDTELEATGSDTYHIVNLLDRVIEFRKDSVALVVPPRNSATVADSIMMKDDDGVEVVSFRILETITRPSMSSTLTDPVSPRSVSGWNLVDVTGSSDILLDDIDARIQIVYNIEMNKKLIVFSFTKIVKNDSEMPLVLQVQNGSFGVAFQVEALLDGYAWFKTSRRGSVDGAKEQGIGENEIVLMHREAVSVSQSARFAIKPYGSADFGYSSTLPVALPQKGKYGLCCQPINDTHAFPLYVRIDQQDTESSGSVHLKPCGVIVNNLPCPIEVEVVSSEGILYMESELIMRNSRRVLYNIDLSYCRVRIITSPDRSKSDWSENIYFEKSSDGTGLRLTVRNGSTGVPTDVKMIYFSDATSKAITFFHPFWLSNCTDVNVIPLIRRSDNMIESVQLGQEGLWYVEPEFDRKLNTMAVTLSRPHTAGAIVSQESSPVDGSYAMMTESFCLLDPMVIHADTIRHYDDVPGVEPKLMDYTLLSVLPRFIVENATDRKVICVRQFGGGNEFTLASQDKLSLGISSLDRSADIQIKVAGESRWSRFAVPLGVDASHSLFVISDGASEDTCPVSPVPLSVRIETVRGITYIRINDNESPAYLVENRCPYIHSVIALAPHMRIGSAEETSPQEIVFSPSADDDKKIPVYFENPDRKVVKLIICFDESSKFKEIELDVSQFTNTLSEAVKIKENIMNARQPILVPCQGFPVVLVSVIRCPDNPSQIIIAVTPKDTGMSNWLDGSVAGSTSPRSSHGPLTRIQPRTSICVNLPRLQLAVCESFQFFVDQFVLKISKKRHDEFSINELFTKSIIIEQNRSEEQVVFATVDNQKGLVLTADRIYHPSSHKESPLSLSDLRLSVSPMELTISNSVLEDIEYVIASFRDAWADHKMIASNSSSLIARSGTPYCLTVDIQSVFESNKLVHTVECHDIRISEIMIHAWSELIYNRSKFISPEIRVILSILSLSDTLRLEGAEINLPSEHIFRKIWRGPSSQLLSTIGDVYKKSLAENAASFSVVASSNMLNVVGGGLFRTSKNKQVNRRLD